MSKLGKYFSLEELTVTHENLDNTPGPIQIQKLKELVKNILDPVREMIDEPIAVNSGYRTLAVNKAIGGARKPISQHTKGEAVDITAIDKADNKELFDLCKTLDFDQLIDESNLTWIHISYKVPNRKQILKL